jgi:methionyl-tRNA formyltransferase
MKIVFMGTPDIAVKPLEALAGAGHEIVCAVSREDKPRGRHGEPVPTPVKAKALELGIPVITPTKLRTGEFAETLRSYSADVFVVIAYGRILPREVLDIPRYGCVNIHASLLPSYRGAAPIQWSILDGRSETGITTMLMDEGCDTGDILRQYSVKITAEDTGESLFDKLSDVGADAIVDTLAALEKGDIKPVKQPAESDTDYARTLTKEDGLLDFSGSTVQLERWVRGLYSWPGAYSYLDGKIFKILRSRISEIPRPSQAKCGEMLTCGGKLLVCTGDGVLEIEELQPEGKKRMSAAAFLNGYKLKEGTILGKAQPGA